MSTTEYARLRHRRAFGARVRELRHERGWTQEQFAEAASLDRSYVSGIESGSRNASLDVIARVASALKVEMSELFPPRRAWPR